MPIKKETNKELNPEYRKRLLKIPRGRFRKFSGIKDLRREIENM